MSALWQQWTQWPLWRQRLGLLVAASAGLAFIALSLWRPIWQAHARAQQQEPILQQAYQQQWQQAQQLPLWVARLTLAEAALSQAIQRLPTATPVDLSQPLHQLVAAHGLTLDQARPLPVETVANLSAYPYALSGSGHTDAVLAFIQRLGDHPEGLMLSSLRLNLAPNQAPLLLHFEAQVHTLRFVSPSPTEEALDAQP
ncbi:MAG: type 4a pilus biogenesis protein PilO [Neisseriaceae bacterium]|nr:type 4a pilus biogenesis protein PilO [Neisseriaceae bacterium]